MRSILLTFILGTFLRGLNLQAQDQIPAVYNCAICGQAISKTAVVVDGKFYHPQCFRCKVCDKPIINDYRKDPEGNYYHPQCYPQADKVICDYCFKAIKEEHYIQYQQKNYHRSCFTRHIAPLCDVCGLPLIDSSYTDYWGNHFHIRHASEYPICFICGRLVVKDGEKIEEDKWLCHICKATSVQLAERARVIAEEVRDQLASIGIVVTTLRIRVELINSNQITRGLPSSSGVHPFAGTSWNAGNTELGDESATIYVLKGLPEDFLRGVIAHELMHIWQHENKADKLPPHLREGSANWAASLIFSRLASERGRFFIRGLEISTDPIYGEGYRLISRYGDKNGIERTLLFLKLYNQP